MVRVKVVSFTEVRCACGWARAMTDFSIKDEFEFLVTSWLDHMSKVCSDVGRSNVGIGIHDSLVVSKNGTVMATHAASFFFEAQAPPWRPVDEFPVVIFRTPWTIQELTELIHISNERSSTLLTSKYLQASTFLTQSGGHL